MRTRSIVTSQPDVACDVCERRLLRGELPEVFLAGGEPRTVCELCAPRAANEGWLREADGDAVNMPAPRPRRGRSLLDRLRQVRKPGDVAARSPVALAAGEQRPAFAGWRGYGRRYGRREPPAEPSPYDFLEGSEGGAAEATPTLTVAREQAARTLEEGGEADGRLDGGAEAPAPPTSEPRSLHERAIAQFNASEYPRRIAGIARSLGAPEVGVRPDEYLRNVAMVVIAWDLCWYRYEVNLEDGVGETRLHGQGTELDELAQEDRLANAVADELGVLSLTGR